MSACRRRMTIGLACALAAVVASASASCAQVLGYERSVRADAGPATDGALPLLDAADAIDAADAAVDPAFACATASPPAIDPSRSVLFRAHLLDLLANTSASDVWIRTCSRADLECSSPKEGPDGGFGPTDAGYLERRVEYGFNGYFELTSKQHYLTTLLFVHPPAVADATGPQVQLLTPEVFAHLASIATGQSNTLDPTLGHAFVHIEDCSVASRGGIRIQPLNVVEGKTRPFYVYDLLPVASAKETDTSGNSGIINLPPGLVTVDAFFADGRTYGSVTFSVRPGVLSYVSVIPKW